MRWCLYGIMLVQIVTSAEDEAMARRTADRAMELMRRGSVDWVVFSVSSGMPSVPRPQTASPVLEETAQAEDPETRFQALEALSESGNPDYLDRFLVALNDPSPPIRELAAGYLAKQDAGQVFARLMELFARGGGEALARLDPAIPLLGARFEPRFMEALADPDETPARKRIAAHCLGRMNSVAAIPALAECAWNSDEATALACIQALLAVRDPIIIARLGELAGHSLPSIRKAAIEGLADAGGPEAFDVLGRLAMAPPDGNEETAREAVLALGAMNTEAAIPLLIEIMRTNVAARRTAVQVLRQLTGDDAGDQPSEWQAWYERRNKALQQQIEQEQKSLYDVEYMK
ncbi:MAG TPA: HEAT repeat domain-containing protein [Candidatus Hydrogenedentes bacterium]|nr:HEAT repeat domain-containing protein [Candidatus Hydrogenedentota bacterium]